MDSSKLVRLVRQVSKEAKASKPFTSFTLKIDGKHNPAALPDGDCWGRNPITWLSVEVVADPETETVGVGHVRQVQRFMQAARPALLTVATPRITSSEGEPMYIADGLTEDIAAVLTPLADTCPDLHHLEVSGDVGSPLLEAFGTCCRKLTILTATDAPAATLERLSELLPRIKTTHVSVSRRDQNFVEHGVVRLSTYRRAISSCCTLTRLDVPGDQMTAEDWRALPSCTTELVWSTAPSLQHVQKNFECALGPPLGVKLPNLKKLTFSDRAFRMSVAMLANLLRAAPQLSCLGTGNLWASLPKSLK
ncbi:MAG: hypothetical protein WDW36_008524 [Sanguina aurantia]